MKVITLTGDWTNAPEGFEFDTKSYQDSGPCPFVGIAIGPDSDDARALVSTNDAKVTLQAGRVLPLRAGSYRIAKLIGSDGNSPFITFQLLLFECLEELAAEIARPNGSYGKGEGSPNGPVTVDRAIVDSSNPAVVGAWAFPFSGRRQARVTIRNVTLAQPIDYSVIGVRWDTNAAAGAGAWVEKVLATATAQAMPVAFYVGGTNEAECWDWIRLGIVSNTPATSGTVAVAADTIGEMGVS